jgi:hypothetical protein
MGRDVLTLHSLKSRPLDERVRLTALLKADAPCDRVVEQLVARLLCDESLAGASWKTLPAMSPVDVIPEEDSLRAAAR